MNTCNFDIFYHDTWFFAFKHLQEKFEDTKDAINRGRTENIMDKGKNDELTRKVKILKK